MPVKHFQVATFDRTNLPFRGRSMMDAVLAKTRIGVEEYLALVFPDRPEPDYVDGEVVERALPTPIHSQIQALLSALFVALAKRARLIPMSELRVRIEPRHFRVIDLAVY
jgi:Uma2 family endonuclease